MWCLRYGIETMTIPEAAIYTEITSYVWPGFLGELNQRTQEFTVWEFVSANSVRHRSDIYAPPTSCLGIETKGVFMLEDSRKRLQVLPRAKGEEPVPTQVQTVLVQELVEEL